MANYGNGSGFDFVNDASVFVFDFDAYDPGARSSIDGPPDDTTGLPEPTDRESERGRVVVVRAGCLACHRLNEQGNVAPGGDLTRVGTRLSEAQIEQVLVNPPAPMPSFTSLNADDRAAVAAYLHRLR